MTLVILSSILFTLATGVTRAAGQQVGKEPSEFSDASGIPAPRTGSTATAGIQVQAGLQIQAGVQLPKGLAAMSQDERDFAQRNAMAYKALLEAKKVAEAEAAELARRAKEEEADDKAKTGCCGIGSGSPNRK